MNFELSSIRKRLAGLLLVLPVMLVLCVVAYKFGPSPAGKAQQTGAPTAPELQPRKPEAEPANSQLFDLFGLYEKAVAKGRVEVAPAEYLNSLENLYRQRGYAKLDINDGSHRKRRKVGARPGQKTTGKFFQREQSEGIGSISAIGTDADYGTDQPSPEPFSFCTLVVPAANGGADWATYRMDIDRSKLKQLANLEHGDFPGADPTNIPRLQGLQRIYALASARGSIAIYKSKETEVSLMMRYLDEMPRHGWRVDPEATSNANKAALGVMCFTKGQSFCMIWITENKETGTTNVTISLH